MARKKYYPECKKDEWLGAACPQCGGAMELCEGERLMVCASADGCGDGRMRLHIYDYIEWFGENPGQDYGIIGE